jgi:hypothetical protein
VSTINGAINSLTKVANEPSVATATQTIPPSAVVLSIILPSGDRNDRQQLALIKARTCRGRLDELHLLDPNGQLLKSVEYKYATPDGKSPLLRERVFLPERPIAVGFTGGGPTITISGETRRYSKMETVQHQGGRRCIVEYGMQKMGDRTLSLPVRIVVYSGDERQVLRSARLYNFAACPGAGNQIEAEAKRYSGFDANDEDVPVVVEK